MDLAAEIASITESQELARRQGAGRLALRVAEWMQKHVADLTTSQVEELCKILKEASK